MPRGQKLFGNLCEHFNLYPDIIYKDADRSCYDYTNRVIELGTKDDRGWKWVLVHEFTHCLDYAKRRREWSYHHHDYEFYRQLLNVVQFAYTNPKQYPWHYEYECIRKYAIADGTYKS